MEPTWTLVVLMLVIGLIVLALLFFRKSAQDEREVTEIKRQQQKLMNQLSETKTSFDSRNQKKDKDINNTNNSFDNQKLIKEIQQSLNQKQSQLDQQLTDFKSTQQNYDQMFAELKNKQQQFVNKTFLDSKQGDVQNQIAKQIMEMKKQQDAELSRVKDLMLQQQQQLQAKVDNKFERQQNERQQNERQQNERQQNDNQAQAEMQKQTLLNAEMLAQLQEQNKRDLEQLVQTQITQLEQTLQKQDQQQNQQQDQQQQNRINSEISKLKNDITQQFLTTIEDKQLLDLQQAQNLVENANKQLYANIMNKIAQDSAKKKADEEKAKPKISPMINPIINIGPPKTDNFSPEFNEYFEWTCNKYISKNKKCKYVQLYDGCAKQSQSKTTTVTKLCSEEHLQQFKQLIYQFFEKNTSIIWLKQQMEKIISYDNKNYFMQFDYSSSGQDVCFIVLKANKPLFKCKFYNTNFAFDPPVDSEPKEPFKNELNDIFNFFVSQDQKNLKFFYLLSFASIMWIDYFKPVSNASVITKSRVALTEFLNDDKVKDFLSQLLPKAH